MDIGFIGLGIMGSRMALNLQKAGHTLTIFNRTVKKTHDLKEKGAKTVLKPCEVPMGNDIVITMLSTPEVVRETALGADGFLEKMSSGTLWLNCSTINPSFAKEMGIISAEKGIRYIDAPVAGTKGPAEKGELVFLVGGDLQDVAVIQPLLDIMGKKTLHLGKVGHGSNMKMLINLLLAQSMLAFSEAMILGEEMDLPRETLFDVLLNVPVTAPFLSMVRPKLENYDYEANFPLQWLQKDLHLATVTAYEQGLAMPSLNVSKELFALAKQNGYGEKDFSAIYAYLKKGSV
ncbi:NAD(P)-dependent oxidoreductase [Flavobacteriaceae bacterium TP-CH-4]|uniref:NAD(P)-dependent oxidoreductase n=1 Tax=Pelagihabitans pacificus TaxID=2696054 RepID=A0A967AUN0_9FLAO|nr:NAD(P)-dependent oxidoreductase [Pelagihabitans pacificus]NHF60704.1 NAD(P)-dependent oxidoreductase [Pelagihabitans pacificus]